MPPSWTLPIAPDFLLPSHSNQDAQTCDTQAVIPVSLLTRTIHNWLEHTFTQAWISGEVSNFIRASSGHWYFVLKEAGAQIRCVMFRSRTGYVDKILQEGDHIEVRATATLYEPRGDLQLTVESIRYAGVGRLYEAFLRLKSTLEEAGLFDAKRKRALPLYPKTIGIMTSPQAAALQDILTTLKRHSPHVSIILYPAPVQGAQAALQLVEQIECAGRRAEVDVLLLCRGGGSIEDLWAFNDEKLAYAIAACPLPIVTGIGHETDFTIADFVADVRAPTPTAAARYAGPDHSVLTQTLKTLHMQLARAHRRLTEQRLQRIDYLAQRLMNPLQQLGHKRQRLEYLFARLTHITTQYIQGMHTRLAKLQSTLVANRPHYLYARARLEPLVKQLYSSITRVLKIHRTALHHRKDRLELLNPQHIFERGYAALIDPKTQHAIRSTQAFFPGQHLRVHVAEGQTHIQIGKVREEGAVGD